ncbi:MAG: hypothetical protein RMM08_02635 [Armatimonadota bacterium]|nr:hypothetical protein [bacterium]MDW8320235.1 hypothetical protein [Armatimonadota bacterium]
MKREIPSTVAVVIIVIALLVAGFYLWRAWSGGKTGEVSDIGMEVNTVIQKLGREYGGDISKLTPEERAVLDRAMQQGYQLPPGLQAQLRGSSGGAPVTGAPPTAPSTGR